MHDSVVIALAAEMEKYSNYQIRAITNTISYVCVHCQDSNELYFFGVPRKFKCYSGGYERETSPEKLVLKENTNIKLLVDDEGQLPSMLLYTRYDIINLIIIHPVLRFNKR